MAITIKHAKTDTIADWTQTDLDAQIALGNFPPGTLLADIVLPSDWNNDHTISGTVPIANGGTGQTTANAAINALLPSQSSQSGKVLSTDGTNTSWVAAGGTGTVTSVSGVSPVSVATGTTTPVISMPAATASVNGYLTSTDWTTFNSKAPATSGTSILYGNGSGGFSNVTIGTNLTFTGGTLNATAGGTGDVVGPASATDNAITRFDTTTGKLIQNSVVIVGDTGSITGVNALTAESLVINNNTTLGSSNTDTLDVNARITTDLEPNTNNAKDIGTSGRNWRDGFFGRTLSTVNLEVTGTTSFDGSQGTAGQVLTSAGTGATPTWTTPTTGTVTSVTGTAPVVSSGGTTPAISMAAASTTVDGYLTSTDWTTFNNKGSGTVTAVSVVSANGLAGSSSGGATPALTLSTTVTGLLKGNGTAISAATSGTDYAPATSGTSILYGNGSGGFSNVTIGTGLSFSTGTLSATATGGVTSFETSLSGLTPSTAATGVVTLAGTLGIGSGGTGQTTATTAFNALAPSQTSNTGKFLKTDGTNTSWSTLPSKLIVLLHSGTSTADVPVANGVLPILTNGGSTINVAVS